MRAIINSDLSEVYAMPIDFSRLQDVSNVLNSKSDTINEAIKAFEAKLASLRLGVSAWVLTPLMTQLVAPGTQNEDNLRTNLGYSKATGAWCLTIMEDSERWGGSEEAPPDFTPLSQASRELRVKAIKQLPLLVKALEEKADEALKEVGQAEQLLRDLSG
jgi:hypothetical protein